MSDSTRPAFIPGLDLARGFYADAVAPILAEVAGDLPYSAALVGPGSEVLGFDDETSTDHHWGPRVLIFVLDRDAGKYGRELFDELANRLPHSYAGYPTNFTPPDSADNGTRLLSPTESGPVDHRVEIVGVREWFADYLGVGRIPVDLDPVEWLTIPQQKLRSIVAGEVFHDGLASSSVSLSAIRAALAWYPDDVWRYQLAAVWQRIAQEEHLAGRAGQAGDELGARLIGSRLVRDMMRLCFLAERRYAPYSKWYGHAFAELELADRMGPPLVAVGAATSWRMRDVALAEAYAELGRIHNDLGITPPMPTEPHSFFGRPISVLAIEGFSEAILAGIDADWITPVMRRSPIGGIDLITDNTDLLEDTAYRASVGRLIRSEP